MSNAAIRAALNARMEAFPAGTLAQDRISYQGWKDFTPPKDGLWIELAHFPSEPRRLFFADGATRRYAGYMQATVCSRRGLGTKAIDTLADAVATHFPEGQRMTDSGVTVRVIAEPAPLSVVEDDGILMLPVPIRYEAII